VYTTINATETWRDKGTTSEVKGGRISSKVSKELIKQYSGAPRPQKQRHARHKTCNAGTDHQNFQAEGQQSIERGE
jgi:hypothetical protein